MWLWFCLYETSSFSNTNEVTKCYSAKHNHIKKNPICPHLVSRECGKSPNKDNCAKKMPCAGLNSRGEETGKQLHKRVLLANAMLTESVANCALDFWDYHTDKPQTYSCLVWLTNENEWKNYSNHCLHGTDTIIISHFM